jgi:hypothetical protein
MEPKESFLARWARLKKAAQSIAESKPATPSALPELPPIEGLNLESDFSAFLRAEVDEKLRRLALKKLFHDPHFNIMDGLDVYIDDYSVSEPIPAAMVQQLLQAQAILTEEPANKAGEEVVASASPSGDAVSEPPAPESPVESPRPDEPTAPDNAQQKAT